jgi:methylenetetrahydrofolate reductase (NADPH)
MPSTLPLSFEFFPPKTPRGREKLLAARDRLAALDPDFFSVTYGAGGSTRDNTRDIVLRIHEDGYPVAPHLSFGGDSEEEILDLIGTYKNAGIRHLVALRGDMPSGVGIRKLVNANELVALVRRHFGDHFHIKVAAYPEIHPDAESYERDIYWLQQKFAAGADCALTQYFYSPDAYFYYMEQCQKLGIDKPVIPGIMPIINFQNLVRFSDNCGADIPRWLRQRMAGFGDDSEGLLAFGEEVVTRLCERLLEGGAPGFHFYTMNRAEPTLAILRNLGIGR